MAARVGLVVRRRVPDAALRLVCVPFAGGGSSVYADWPALVDPRIEVLAVQLAGRENRLRQEPFTDVAGMVPAIAEVLGDDGPPLALFGHSMGAVVVFELARWLRAHGAPDPVHVFVSARRAPHLPARHPAVHEGTDEQLVARVRELGGAPAQLLDDPKILAMLLPTLRADFGVNDGYRYRDGEPLSCPLSALGGLGDGEIDRRALAAWGAHTTGPFRTHVFPGGHFYLREQIEPLTELVSSTLLPDRAPAAR